MRIERAERFATSNARSASTLPVPPFAWPFARLDSAARAASMASSSSDLPLRRLSWRFGRSTSITVIPDAARCRAKPGPYVPVPSTRPGRSARTPPASSPARDSPPVWSGTTRHPTGRRSGRSPRRHGRRGGCRHHRQIGRVTSTMAICHPFSRSNGQGVARTSREGDRDERAAANSWLDHPPERGVPCCTHTEQQASARSPAT
jgi:hypothetical protein